MTTEAPRLARAVQDQIGEDNVRPWLLVHGTLVQAALRGYKIGLQRAVRRAHEERN